MDPAKFRTDVMMPGLAFMTSCLGEKPDTGPKIQTLLLATAGQESNWTDRLQQHGPARSFWQFEKRGGVLAVLTHSVLPMQAICRALEIPFAGEVIFEAMAWNDHLATAMARLNYWRDPNPIPHIGDEEGSWQYYLRVWGPGKPDRARWAHCYKQAWDTMLPFIPPVTMQAGGIPRVGGTGNPAGTT